MQAVDAQSVPHDIQQVHPQGGQHGDPGISLGAKNRGNGIIDRQEREGAGGVAHIYHGAFHDRRLHMTEDQPQDLPSSCLENDGEHEHSRGGDPQKLRGAFRRPGVVPGADKFGADHGTAGGEGKKDLEDQMIDGVHKGDAGHRFLPQTGDHQDVDHPHQDGEKLLDHQGPEHLQEPFPVKQRLIREPKQGTEGIHER